MIERFTSRVWRAGVLISQVYDWDGRVGVRVTVCLGHTRLTWTNAKTHEV